MGFSTRKGFLSHLKSFELDVFTQKKKLAHNHWTRINSDAHVLNQNACFLIFYSVAMLLGAWFPSLHLTIIWSSWSSMRILFFACILHRTLPMTIRANLYPQREEENHVFVRFVFNFVNVLVVGYLFYFVVAATFLSRMKWYLQICCVFCQLLLLMMMLTPYIAWRIRLVCLLFVPCLCCRRRLASSSTYLEEKI